MPDHRFRDRPAPGRPPAEAARRRPAATPVAGGPAAGDVRFELVGDARFVLIGEVSRGPHEVAAVRARMTRRRIEERGFRAVAVEARGRT